MRSLFRGWGRNKLPQDRTEEILAKYLDQDFKIYPLAETAVTEAQFRSLEARFGVKYPPEYVAHVLGRFPAVYVEVKEAIWPRPKEFDVGPFWSFLYAVHTYTSAPESEPWMRLDAAAEAFRKHSPDLIAAPVLRIEGDADVYCATADGSIAQFKHETGELEPFSGDFWHLFEIEIRELRERKERKKNGSERT